MNKLIILVVLALFFQASLGCFRINLSRSAAGMTVNSADNGNVIYNGNQAGDTTYPSCDGWKEKDWGGSSYGHLKTRHNCRDLGENQWLFTRSGFSSGWMNFNGNCPIFFNQLEGNLATCSSNNYNC
ncbi:hypothetical protein SAMD00019534_079700, partial [Acytostelium subglobosum LB1]|uniref:hypothetical protein n=1 Tax=Acytostelium subglobosum LB1 TaxID=1410327 RepID=UPI0006448A94